MSDWSYYKTSNSGTADMGSLIYFIGNDNTIRLCLSYTSYNISLHCCYSLTRGLFVKTSGHVSKQTDPIFNTISYYSDVCQRTVKGK